MSGLGSSPETQNKISKANSSNDMLTKVSGDFKTKILLQFCIRIFKKTSMIFKVQGVPGIVLGCQIRQKLVFVECIGRYIQEQCEYSTRFSEEAQLSEDQGHFEKQRFLRQFP